MRLTRSFGSGRRRTGSDRSGAALNPARFNTISPESALKWGSVHPRVDGYSFGPAGPAWRERRRCYLAAGIEAATASLTRIAAPFNR